MHSLLFALLVILYLSLSPGIKEGYETTKIVESKKTKDSKKSKDSSCCGNNNRTPKHRWGDEIIFDESPTLVENDNVVTEQIQ